MAYMTSRQRRKAIQNARKARSINPLKYDPTRTGLLRQAFVRRLKKQFAILRGRIFNLVVKEDCFGLRNLTEDVSNFNPDQPRDEKGQFASDGSGGSSEVSTEVASKSFMNQVKDLGSKIGAKASEIEHVIAAYAKDKIIAAVSKLPEPAQVAVNHIYAAGKIVVKGAFSAWTATQALAERVARERGATEEEARRLRGVLSSIDIAAFKPIAVGTAGLGPIVAGATWIIPPATGAYLAYSTAKNPIKTAKAAVGLVSEAVGRGATSVGKAAYRFATRYPTGAEPIFNAHFTANAAQDSVNLVAQALEDHGYSDWYIALLSAAFDEQVGSSAITVANKLFAIYPTAPDSESITANGFVANRWQAKTSPEKVAEFQSWLRKQYKSSITSSSQEDVWERYAEEGYKKGAARSFDDVRKPALKFGPKEGEFYKGSKAEFLRSSFAQPVAKERMQMLASRSFDDLENVTSDMSARMSRTLMDGLVRGDSPLTLGKQLGEDVDLGEARAETIARTEIIRAHAEGQLDSLKALGVDEVGVEVEFFASGNACPECVDMDETAMPIDEARGIIPYHPNCKCAWIPANIEEAAKEPVSNARNQRFNSQALINNAIRNLRRRAIVAETHYDILNHYIRQVNEARERELQQILNANWDETQHPRDASGKFTAGAGDDVAYGIPFEIPSDKNQVKLIKELPGSTNPKLVEDKHGVQWVMKGPGEAKADQTRNEANADDIYRAAGIAVPESGLVETNQGPVKFSEFLDKGQTLSQWEKGKSEAEKLAMYKEIGKGFAMDALMANWDVIGMGSDNILIHDGKVIRIDNGGALKYRAQGSPKGHLFDEKVGELQTMREGYKNPSAVKVFGHLKKEDIDKQIKELMPKKDAILKAVKDPETKAILEKRFDYLAKSAGLKPGDSKQTPEAKPVGDKSQSEKAVSKAASDSTPQLSTAQGSDKLHDPEKLSKYLGEHKGDGNFTTLWLDKIKYLNPEGTKDGTLRIPQMATKKLLNEKVDALKALLPPSTVIKSVSGVTAHKVAKDVAAGKVKMTVESKNIAKHIITKKFGDEGTFKTVKAADVKSMGEEKFTHHPTSESKLSSGDASKLMPPPDPEKGIENWPNGKLANKKEQEEWKKTLTLAEKSVISNWKGSASSIRKQFYAGKLREDGKAMLSAITKSPPHEGLVYRGISGEYAASMAKQFSEAGVGGLWSDPAPHCMSPNLEIGKSFAGGKVLLRIHTKTGRPIHKEDGYSDEAEITGMPGTQYKIKAIHKDVKKGSGKYDGKIGHIIDLEEV